MGDSSSPGALNETVLRLEVATPRGMAIDLEVRSVEVPSVEGEFGVLAGHRPLLAALRYGVLRYRGVGDGRSATRPLSVAIGPGVAEVNGQRVRVLTDCFEVAAEVDVAAVEKALADAEHELAQGVGAGFEADRLMVLQQQVDWAQARLAARRELDQAKLS